MVGFDYFRYSFWQAQDILNLSLLFKEKIFVARLGHQTANSGTQATFQIAQRIHCNMH